MIIIDIVRNFVYHSEFYVNGNYNYLLVALHGRFVQKVTDFPQVHLYFPQESGRYHSLRWYSFLEQN